MKWASVGLLAAVCSALWAALVAAEPLSPEERALVRRSGRVGAAVAEAFAVEERVPVFVVFAEPSADLLRRGKRRFGPDVERAIARRRAAVLGRLAKGDFEVRRRFRALRAVSGHVSRRGLLRLLEDERVLRVDYDGGGSGGLYQSLPLVNVDTVQQLGLSGQGVTVAVLDSGVDKGHPDIGAAAVVAEQCYCSGGGGCCPNGMATMSGTGAAVDDHGHGTHVTGIITSDGGLAPTGAAPDAQIVAVKVLDSNNTFSMSSDVVAGLDWIIANNDTLEVEVVNMSLGTNMLFVGDCDGATSYTIAYADAIDTLRADGVISVVSAMNDASKTHMAAPACVRNAISVGAVWDAHVGSPVVHGCSDSPTFADLPTCWSNSNSVTDLFAPGAPVDSTKMGGGTATFFGTSQAAPIVAGCAALLREFHPALSPDQLERSLEMSPTWVTDPGNGLSFPRLDCEAALEDSKTFVPALGLGAQLALSAALLAAAWSGLGRARGRVGRRTR